MEKAESLSFPTVPGSGGCRQSLHNEILVGAKRLNWVPAVIQFLVFFSFFSEIFVPEFFFLQIQIVYTAYF